MSTNTTVGTDAGNGQHPAGPWQASIQARLTRGIGVDQFEQVDFNAGQFDRRIQVIGGPSDRLIQVLGDQDQRDLLGELHGQLQAPSPGTDVASLEVFADLLEESLRREPSSRFDNVRFGQTDKDESRGIIFGHVSMGVDVVGTVRDAGHHLTFDQHPVELPPGNYTSLSAADRASLTRALQANPQGDPNWQQILTDAQL